MSNRTLVDIKKILKEYKIPTSLNKPELLLILDTVEKLKEKGESEDKIKEEGYKKYSEVRKSVKGVMEATGAVEKKIEMTKDKKGVLEAAGIEEKKISMSKEDAINEYKTLLERYNKKEINLDRFVKKTVSVIGKTSKVQRKIISESIENVIRDSKEEINTEAYVSFINENVSVINKKSTPEEIELLRQKISKEFDILTQQIDSVSNVDKTFKEIYKGTLKNKLSDKEKKLKKITLEKMEEIKQKMKKLEFFQGLATAELEKKIQDIEAYIIEEEEKQNEQPPLLSQEAEEEKQNEPVVSEEEKQNLSEEEKQNLSEEEKQNEPVVVEEPVIETPNDILAKQKLLFELFSRDEISPDEYMQKNEEFQNTLNKLIDKEQEGYVNEPLNSTEKYIEIFKKFKNGEIDKEEFKKLASQILLFADDLTEEDKTILKEDIAIEEDINKKNEKLLDMIEGLASEFQNGKIKEEEIIKKIEIINDDSELVQDEKELLINRLQKVVDDKREETQKSVNEIQDIINVLQPIVSQYDNGFINKELFDIYVDERLLSVPERQKTVVKNVLNQFSEYKEKEYEDIKTEENKELENSIRVFDEQNVEKVLQDRITQERYEGLNVPYKTVDAIEDSDPPTGTVPMVQIMNEDQPTTVDPNLPINMQQEPVMRALDPEVVGGATLVPKVEESIITGPTSTNEVLAEIKNNLRGQLYAQNDTNQALGDIAGAVNNVSGALNDVVGAINNTSSVVSDNAEPPAEPPIPPVDTVAEPLVEEPLVAPTLEEKLSGPPLKVEITYEVKYHKFQVNEFFGSIDNPDWDLGLNKSITGNYDNGYYTKEILLEQIAGMISDKKLKIYVQATTIDDSELDILIEYAIVSQLHFCVLRNLQRGNRTKTAMVPLKSLIDLRNTVANSSEPTTTGTEPTTATNFQPTPTQPAPEEVPNVLKRDITIKDISEKFTDRKYRGNVILYDNVYKNIVKSGHEHSGGNNVIFGPSNLDDPLGLMDDFINPYKNPKYIIKTTIK